MMTKSRSSPVAFVVLLLGTLVVGVVGGCAGNDRIGEQVQLRMLTPAALESYSQPDTNSGLFLSKLGSVGGESAIAQFDAKVLQLKEEKWLQYVSQHSPILVGAVPLLAGAAIQLITNRLDEAAGRFEAQWGSSRMVDGYWRWYKENELDGDAAAGWRPRYIGVEMIRSTSKITAAEGGASRLVLLFLPSKSDGRLFLVYPLYYANRSAKAQLGMNGSTISASVALSMAATWVGKDDRAVQVQIAEATFDIGGYDVSTPIARFWSLPDRDAVGWFAAGPMSPPDPAILKHPYYGVFRIGVAVTERDESSARQWIERSSKYLTENSDSIIERITEGTSDEQ